MRRLSGLAICISAFAILTGCATSGIDAGTASPSATPPPVDHEKLAAQQQAQAWLDAAALPPGAIPAKGASPGFNSFQGWSCRPIAELKAYWTIPDTSVADTANWLLANPTADLVSTRFAPASADPDITETMVGFIPADDSHQGVVYTVREMHGGVTVRAEIAALTESAVCPSLEPGTMLGKPGQG